MILDQWVNDYVPIHEGHFCNRLEVFKEWTFSYFLGRYEGEIIHLLKRLDKEGHTKGLFFYSRSLIKVKEAVQAFKMEHDFEYFLKHHDS